MDGFRAGGSCASNTAIYLSYMAPFALSSSLTMSFFEIFWPYTPRNGGNDDNE
jgi:hypothetical protein